MLFSFLSRAVGRGRTWTLQEVRDLIEAGDFDAARKAASHLNPMTPKRDAHLACLTAELAFHAGKDDEAEAGFRRVLQEYPGFPDAHYGLSVVLAERGDVHTALEHATFARVADPSQSRYWAQLGLCQLKLTNYAAAEPLLTHAVHIRSSDHHALNNLGIVLAAKGDFVNAKIAIDKALKLRPGFASALDNSRALEEMFSEAGLRVIDPKPAEPDAIAEDGTAWMPEWEAISALRKGDQTEAALSRAESLCLQHPDDSDLHRRSAGLYRMCGEHQGGVELLKSYLLRNPGDAKAQAVIGNLYLAADEYAPAAEHLGKARELGEQDEEVLVDHAASLHKLERYTESLGIFESLVESNPDGNNRYMLASALVAVCRYPQARDMFELLLAEGEVRRERLLPNYAYALLFQGEIAEANDVLDELMERQPNEPSLRTARFVTRMLLGDYARAWDDYAYRGISFSRSFRVLPFEKWTGQPLEGKRIVVLAEQGLGDQVMLASCLPDLLACKPAQVIVEAVSRVAPTIERSFPQCQVIASNQKSEMTWAKNLGPIDYFVPLGDLPAQFRRDLKSFPGTPYLKADPARVAHWRAKLERSGPGPYIGVSWRGGTQITRGSMRSMVVDEFGPMMDAVPGTYVCLQYGDVAPDLKTPVGSKLVYWPDSITKLDDFAALICALDAVASVCNTTIHYAGALGKPVWVLAPRIPEWRYGLTEPRMTWYNCARVVRQDVSGDWAPVLATAAREIRDYLDGQKGASADQIVSPAA